MCDIKTEPDDSVCRGCLSRDRKLSPLPWYDLYWSLLTEDQKIESLVIPQIMMCWECNAIVGRIQKFQLQVQKAHNILRESLELSPPKETLSPLGVQHKREYDAIFKINTIVQQLPIFKAEVPIISEIQCDTQFKEDTEDDALKSEDAAKTDNKIKANVQKYSDDEYKIEKSSDNDDDYFEADNMLSSSADQTHTEQNKPRRSSRRRALKNSSSQIFKKTKKKDGIPGKAVITLPTQFVAPTINPETEILLSKVNKTEVKIKKIKPVPLIKTPVITQLEMQLKNLIKLQSNSTVDINRHKNGSKRRKKNEIKNKDIDEFLSGFSSDDDNFRDMECDNECDDEADALLNKKDKTKLAPLFKNPALLKLELELKQLISENAKADSACGKTAKRKRGKNEQVESDPDFNPDENYEPKEEITDVDAVDGENKQNGMNYHKYKRVISQYDNVEDVLQYFTETKMDEQEFKSILEKEDAIVNDKKPQKCFECGVCFQFRRTLLRHAKNIHKINDYKLVKTPKIQIPEPTEKPRLWRCSMCKRMLRKEHTLAHMNEHHRYQWFCNGKGCEWCSKIFWDRDDMMEHWTNIHKRFLCDYCGRLFRRKSALEWHIRETHIQLRCLPCTECARVFAARKDLYQHVRLQHSTPGPEELRYCVECDVTFRSAARYSLHISSKHKPKKTWPCDVCGRVLMNKCTLESHVAIHHGGVTRFQCEICGKYLSKKSTLEVHILRHKNIVVKPPNNKPCSVCGRKFQSNRTLRHHMYTHTGERPYACTHCDAAYTQPYCLRVHLSKAHGIEKAVPEHPPADDK